MLAAHALDVKSIVKRLQGQQYTSEYKYDGERAQVHISEGKVVAVAARNLKDISHKYPELSDLLPRVWSSFLASHDGSLTDLD